MDDAKQEIHNPGTMQGTVLGNYNTTTINIENKSLQKNESYPQIFLAPPRPREFVGRDKLLRDLKRRLLSGETLAIFAFDGLPGVGKTTLAIALAHDREVLEHYSDGVLWAGLGPNPDILTRLSEWGIALGISRSEMEKLASIKDRQRAIRAAIGVRRMLLVADDAWEAKSAEEFKLGGPNCAYIVTTRLQEVASFVADEGSIDVRELSEDDGLKLLKRLIPEIVKAEPKEARKLVRAVGGLPLALTIMGKHLHRQAHSGQKRRLRKAQSEMNLAKTRLELDLPQSELDSHTSLPTGTPLSLMAVIKVSDDTLDETAYQALRALSVFPPKPNTFSEEAALAVANVSIETLDTLVDSRLLESSTDDRYMLHQTIADYASIQLTDMTVYERMVEYFMNFIENNETDYSALEHEASNVLAALSAAFEQRMQAHIVKKANAFFPLLQPRGMYKWAENFLKLAEEADRASGDSIDLAKTLLNLGELAERQGNYANAESYLGEGLTLARQEGQLEIISALLRNLGEVARDHGEYDQAEAYLQEGLDLARGINNPGIISGLLITMGAVAKRRANYGLAKQYLLESLNLARQIKHRGRMCGALGTLGDLEALLGNFEQAEAYLQEGLDIARESDLQGIISGVLSDFGKVLALRGDYERSEEYLQEGLDLARQIKHQARISSLLSTLGTVADHQGHYEQAKEYLQEGLTLARKIGHRTNTCVLLQNTGMAAIHCGDYEKAKDFLQEALSLASQVGLRRTICTLLSNLSSLARITGDDLQAEKHLQESLSVAREIGDYRLIGETQLACGELYLSQKKREAAFASFTQAVQTSDEISSEYLAALAFYGLARTMAAQRNYAKARDYCQRSLAFIQNHEKAKEVALWLDKLSSMSSDEE